jgi:hypothetical protein
LVDLLHAPKVFQFLTNRNYFPSRNGGQRKHFIQTTPFNFLCHNSTLNSSSADTPTQWTYNCPDPFPTHLLPVVVVAVVPHVL